MMHAMVKVGAFPHLKEIKDFDFSFQLSINEQQILDFFRQVKTQKRHGDPSQNAISSHTVS